LRTRPSRFMPRRQSPPANSPTLDVPHKLIVVSMVGFSTRQSLHRDSQRQDPEPQRIDIRAGENTHVRAQLARTRPQTLPGVNVPWRPRSQSTVCATRGPGCNLSRIRRPGKARISSKFTEPHAHKLKPSLLTTTSRRLSVNVIPLQNCCVRTTANGQFGHPRPESIGAVLNPVRNRRVAS